uniref:SDR family oxidoreductase n=1 Tax=Olsenella uli TaxID=133926 RepID=UPI0036F2941D
MASSSPTRRRLSRSRAQRSLVWCAACASTTVRPGVRINAVAPGMTATDMNKSVWSVPEKVTPFAARTPTARIGQAEDIFRHLPSHVPIGHHVDSHPGLNSRL